MEDLDGPNLFDSMFVEDPEAEKMAALPEMDDLLSGYKEKFMGICQEIFELGLKEHTKREAEISSFVSSVDDAFQENKSEGVKKIEEYIEFKKKVWICKLSKTLISEKIRLVINIEYNLM